MKEKLDPSWHKARVAARIWLKAQTRPLNARDRRLARLFAQDRGVTNRLIQQGVLGSLGGPYRTIDAASGKRRALESLDDLRELRHVLGRED